MASKKEYTNIDLGNYQDKKVVCLTLDLEQDYGDLLDEPSYEGLSYIDTLVGFLKSANIPLTCFVQGSLLETHAAQIERLFALDVEFELHSYSHSKPRETDMKYEVERGIEAYRGFFHKDPLGYRSPLGAVNIKDHYEVLTSNGFKFDSSVFPSLRPGVFNNLRKSTKPYLVDDFRIVEFPFAVFSPAIRIPIALSYIKLLGKPYSYALQIVNLPNLIVFDFHLHDLFDLDSSCKIPFEKRGFIYRLIFRRIYQNSKGGLAILDELITRLQEKGYSFKKLIDVYEGFSE